MCLTAFEFILLYVLIIGLWINNWFFFQAITVVPKHSVCITTPWKSTKLPFVFSVGLNELKFAHLPVQEIPDFSLLFSHNVQHTIFWYGQSDLPFEASRCLGMRQGDTAPSALLRATPDRIKRRDGESPSHSCLFSLLLRKPLLEKDCIKKVSDFHMT